MVDISIAEDSREQRADDQRQAGAADRRELRGRTTDQAHELGSQWLSWGSGCS